MKKKVLVCIVSHISNQGGFDRIITQFQQNGFEVHLFNDDQNELDITSLPNIINYVNQLEMERIERLAILSNIREYLFTWYRIYNSLVDDFIYFVDTGYPSKLIPEPTFFKELYEFTGIENETLEGKIYATFDWENVTRYGVFLLDHHRFTYFDTLSNFHFHEHKPKQALSKSYKYANDMFQFDSSQLTSRQEIVKLQRSEWKLKIDDEFLVILECNPYFILIFTRLILQLDSIEKSTKTNILCTLFERLGKKEHFIQEYIYKDIVQYVEQSKIPFAEKIYLLVLLTKFETVHDLLERILQTMVQDETSIPDHYSLLMNTLVYINYDKLPVYQNLYNDRAYIMERMVQHYKHEIKLPVNPKRKPKRIAIVVSQLLSLLHSPTLLALNNAKYLKQYFPGYEIKIFVEDIFLYPSEEVFFPYVFSAAYSGKLMEAHKEFLKGTGIQVYYTDIRKPRRERIQEDINAICNFAPEVIWTIGNHYSINAEILYDYYPILDASAGGVSNSEKADIYIGGSDINIVAEEYEKFGINPKRKYFYYMGGVDFPETKKDIKRTDYKLNDNNYVMVTIGNRLDTEMNETFVEMVGSFLKEHSLSRWIIVGPGNHDIVRNSHPDLINQQKIVFITYEEDLGALYKICDIYLNPIRKGGGFSGALAMYHSVPVLTLKGNYDITIFVGEELSVADLEQYSKELKKMYDDSDYKQEKGHLMKARLEDEFGYKKAMMQVNEYINMAIAAFKIRTSK